MYPSISALTTSEHMMHWSKYVNHEGKFQEQNFDESDPVIYCIHIFSYAKYTATKIFDIQYNIENMTCT